MTGQNDVKDGVHLGQVHGQNLLLSVHLDDVNQTIVLSKDQVLVDGLPWLGWRDIVPPQHDVVNALLQLLVVLLLERVEVEHKQMAIVASNPAQLVVDLDAEESMARSFLHDDSPQVLIVHMQLVAFASGKDQARIVATSRRDVRTSPVQNGLRVLHFQQSPKLLREFGIAQIADYGGSFGS